MIRADFCYVVLVDRLSVNGISVWTCLLGVTNLYVPYWWYLCTWQ